MERIKSKRGVRLAVLVEGARFEGANSNERALLSFNFYSTVKGLVWELVLWIEELHGLRSSYCKRVLKKEERNN
jgi:hypothetical protein